MGYLTPREPDVDRATWRTRTHHERVHVLARDCAVNGSWASDAVRLGYLIKLLVFLAGGVLVVAATPGTGSLLDLPSWWASPIALQKFVVWGLLWEVLGLGAGSGPLAFRFAPAVGGPLYWLRPGTVRLPPWPGRIAYTTGTRRTVVDAALYVGVLASCAALLVTGSVAGATYDTLPHSWLWALLLCLGVLGLRDRTPFLAARPELYAVMLLVFAFPPQNMVFALKLVLLAMWWGAATAALTQHAPFAMATVLSQAPWSRPERAARLWRDHASDLRPSREAAWIARGSTAVQYVVPLVLILSRGGWLTVVAVTVMALFHVAAAATFSAGVPLERHAVVVYATVVLFGRYASTGESTLSSLPLAMLLLVLLTVPAVVGLLVPRVASAVIAQRQDTGNAATSVWLFRAGAEAAMHTGAAPAVATRLAAQFDDVTSELLLGQQFALRALHPNGRALNGLLGRAVDNLPAYTARDGELVANALLGWACGDGHLHDDRLLAAVQERCGFAPGDLRVVTLEAQPLLRATQRYRITDAAAGKLEEGVVRVADMAARQPWESGIPVEVTFQVLPPAQRRVLPSTVRPRPAPAPAPPPVRIGCDGAKPASRPRPRPAPAVPQPAAWVAAQPVVTMQPAVEMQPVVTMQPVGAARRNGSPRHARTPRPVPAGVDRR